MNIDVWQLQYEMDDDDLADLPETGWEIEAVDRDDDYDDGYRYTIVHTRHDDWQFEVSSSVLKKYKPIRKGRMFKEFSKKFGKKFNESYDSDYAKEKFFGIMMNELGLSQDEIEEMVEKWDEDYDAMNDIMLKFLDGKPLDRMEQIQAAYYLCDKLENYC